MVSIELLYNLSEDPDSFWIINDLCIENNWATPDCFTYPCWLTNNKYIYIDRSYFGYYLFSSINAWGGALCGDRLGGTRSNV